MRGEAREGMFVASPLALELDTERPEIDAILKKEEKKICCYFISVHICHHKSLWKYTGEYVTVSIDQQFGKKKRNAAFGHLYNWRLNSFA